MIVSRLAVKRALSNAGSKFLGRNLEIAKSRPYRFFSTPAKSPPTQQNVPPEPEAANKASASPPKAQASTVPKSSTPQVAQKPSVKTAQTQATAAKPGVSPKPQVVQAGAAASQKAPASPVGQKAQAAPPVGQKAQASPQVAQAGSAARAATGVGAKVTPPVSRVNPPSGQRAQATSGTAQSPNRLKLLLASGVAGSLVLGLVYWQFPKIQDGPTETGDKGKDASSSAGLTHEKSNLEGERVDSTGISDTENEEKETRADITVEAETVKVEAAPEESQPPVSERSELQTDNKADASASEQPPTEELEPEVPTEQIVVEIKPDRESSEEISITVSKEVGSDAEAVGAKEENVDISEPLLLQRSHEDYIKKSDEFEKRAADGTSARHPGLDVVAAIHAAEHRQAEIDAIIFREKLQELQEKYQHELTDVERKASSYQEEIRKLEEGLEKQKLAHEDHLRRQQEEAESEFQYKLKLMDDATQLLMEEVELRAKSEASAGVIEERVSFLSDIGSLKVHMEALNAALEAKSEEAREGHEIKQLSLGAFALEDALSKGAPIEKEVESLLKSAGGDPLVEVAVTTLPKEVLKQGTLTPAELNRQLTEIEGALRELALIPAAGGGVLCHLIARIASSLKLPDHALHPDSGVDAVLSRVQDFVKSGKLIDAADDLSLGLSGTNADKLAGEWARQARNRAVAEQACALLRAHAAAMALSDYMEQATS